MDNLPTILDILPEDFNVPDSQYQEWKKYFEKLNEVDKIDEFNATVANYLLGENRDTAETLAFFITCTLRWTNEKNLEDFLDEKTLLL